MWRVPLLAELPRVQRCWAGSPKVLAPSTTAGTLAGWALPYDYPGQGASRGSNVICYPRTNAAKWSPGAYFERDQQHPGLHGAGPSNFTTRRPNAPVAMLDGDCVSGELSVVSLLRREASGKLETHTEPLPWGQSLC